MTLDLDGLGEAGPRGCENTASIATTTPPSSGPGPLRDGGLRGGRADTARLAELTRALEGDDPAAQRAARSKSLSELDPATRQAALPAVLRLAGQSKDPGVREAAADVARKALGPVAYPRAVVDQIRESTECRPTRTTTRPRGADGRLLVTARVAANGCNFLVIDRDDANPVEAGPGR